MTDNPPTSAPGPSPGGLAASPCDPGRSPAEMTDRELRDACRAYNTPEGRASWTMESHRALLDELSRRWRI